MFAYAYIRLTEEQLYEMELNELASYLRAEINKQKKELEVNMRLVSWQTAHLMTATGNYKSPVKPTDLYDPDNQLETTEKAELTKEEQEKQLQELLESFGVQ